MNKKETLRILQLIAAAYPKTFNIEDENKLSLQMEIWCSCFTDENYTEVAQALKYHISTDVSGFPPVIGKLKESIYKMHNPNELTELDAWNLVKKALRNSLYNASEEFYKLPEVVQSCVGSPQTLRTWSQNDSDEINTVIASNFQRSYKSRAKSYKEVAMLPSSIRNVIGIASEETKLIDNELMKKLR